MEAYFNKQEIKDKYLARVIAHQRADEIIKGTYWENGKGCAVGCTVHSSNHQAYETELGIPYWLAKVEDRIFEGLPNARAKLWPSEFLEAITPGQDLDKIKIPFLIFVVELSRENFDHKKYPNTLKAIDSVLLELKRDVVDQEKLYEARRAAAAAYAAAYADADAAAAYAAYAAAYADAAAAAYAYAAYAARENAYVKFADKILELIGAKK